jgi:hypothetical protein
VGINNQLVQGLDGAFYGFVSVNSSQFYRLAADGSYTTLCAWGSGTLSGDLTSIVAANDGSFVALEGRDGPIGAQSVVRLSPTTCALNTVFTIPPNSVGSLGLVSVVQGADGNLYANDNITVTRITPGGVVTPLASFNTVTSRVYVPGAWVCKDGTCYWEKGGWDPFPIKMSAQGSGPSQLLAGNDGNLYFQTLGQGLNGYGSYLRLAMDGTLTELFSPRPEDMNMTSALTQLTDGRLVRTGANSQVQLQLLEISTQSPLSTSISFSNSSVNLWQRTTLSWSSTGAQSCQLISDIPGVAAATAATSGSKKVAIYSKEQRTPAQFTAGLQCTAADGSVSNAAATVTIN